MTNALFKKRQSRTRHRLATHGTRPRLSIFRSGKHIYAQVIDDAKAVTVASASTNEKEAKGKGYNVAAAERCRQEDRRARQGGRRHPGHV